jgi:hypothetical protein
VQQAVLEPAVKRAVVQVGKADGGGFAQHEHAEGVGVFLLRKRSSLPTVALAPSVK